MPGLVDCGVVLRTALPSGNAFFFFFLRRLISPCRVQFTLKETNLGVAPALFNP